MVSRRAKLSSISSEARPIKLLDQTPYSVYNASMTQESNHGTFYDLGIAPAILDVLDKLKFKTPTPIQQRAIPIAIEGKDVLGIAQTGTGKTLAFGIPLTQLLAKGPGRALVVVPTRELALQVEETLRRIAQPFNIRTVVLIGGMSMGMQVQTLKKSTTRILIATPGRIIDHLEQKTTHLNDIKMVVLDEADRMLDMGFAPQIQRLARYMPVQRQTSLFSATMPDSVLKIAQSYMKLPIRIEMARAGATPEKIVQEIFIVRQESKRALLAKLLTENTGSVLIFSRTKIGARKITLGLRQMNFMAAEIHSDRSLGQRREALDGFKTGRYRILVATDIAARGIDVKGISLVVNYDLPEDVDNYVHRIGRTGRAGQEGRAISLVLPDQGGMVRDIERIMRSNLKVSVHAEFPEERLLPSASGGNFAPRNHRKKSLLSRPGFRGGRGRSRRF